MSKYISHRVAFLLNLVVCGLQFAEFRYFAAKYINLVALVTVLTCFLNKNEKKNLKNSGVIPLDFPNSL